jgi:hypothetical protein
MAAGITYTPIAETTLSTTASTITLSSIPGTYTDLILACSILGSGSPSRIYLNTDSATTLYSYTELAGDGSSASSSRQSGTFLPWTGNTNTTTPLVSIIHINNYANTNVNKTMLIRHSQASSHAAAVVGLWRNTAAVTAVNLTGGTFNAGSTFSLYGITAA